MYMTNTNTEHMIETCLNSMMNSTHTYSYKINMN